MKPLASALVLIFLVQKLCFFVHVEARDGFIRTRGIHFMLNGDPFYANGFNAYWLMYVASDPSQRSKVSAAFREASSHGLTVARTWAFSDGGYKPLQYAPGSYNEDMFKGLDFVIAEARRYGIKLVLSLANNYDSFGGKKQYVNWARSHGQYLNSDDDFFRHPLVKGYYKNHIRTVLNRYSKFNGVVYKNDPTIMAWELMNEPRCTSDPSGRTIQIMRPSYGNPTSNRGRGNRGRGTGRGAVLVQLGKQRLIAEDLTGSSSSNNKKDDTMSYQQYQQFLEWKNSQEKQNEGKANMPESYSSVIVEDDNENIQSYVKIDYKELILFLEHRDLQWKDEPWKLMAKYLNNTSYPSCTYKYRAHFEMILSGTGSCEISHFYPANTRKVYNFSKIIIKHIILPEEWGLSTLTERSYIHPEQKVPVKFNYWDYVESFHKALLYENDNRKHSWFIKICGEVYKQSSIPNWFSQWWITYGPTVKILPEPLLSLYTDWLEVSPKIQELQRGNTLIEGSCYMNFFIEYSIPWIMKWTVEVDYTPQNIPALYRNFYTRFWKKMIQKTTDGHMQCQDTIDNIKQSIEEYKQIDHMKQQNTPSPYQHIINKIQMKKGLMTKAEILASYFEEVKKDLIKNLEIEIPSDASMASVNNTEDEEEQCLAGESQSITDNGVDDYITNIMTQIAGEELPKVDGEASFSKKHNTKGKDKA